MKQEMHQPKQLSRTIRDQGVQGLITIEKTCPCQVRDFIGQGGFVFAVVKRVVAIPKRFPLRKIAVLEGASAAGPGARLLPDE